MICPATTTKELMKFLHVSEQIAISRWKQQYVQNAFSQLYLKLSTSLGCCLCTGSLYFVCVRCGGGWGGVAVNCALLCWTLQSHGLWNPWGSPGKNTGVGCHALLQIFPIQAWNPGFLHCRRILYPLSHQGNPGTLEWITYPFSRRSSPPRNQTGVSCICRQIPYQLSFTILNMVSKTRLDDLRHTILGWRCLWNWWTYEQQQKVWSFSTTFHGKEILEGIRTLSSRGHVSTRDEGDGHLDVCLLQRKTFHLRIVP